MVRGHHVDLQQITCMMVNYHHILSVPALIRSSVLIYSFNL